MIIIMQLLEEVKVIEGTKGTLLSKYTAKLPLVSLLDYRAWLFGKPHSINKDKLLELTLFPFPPDERSITYYQMCESNLSKLTQASYTLPEVFFSKEWYTYQHPGHFYVDFAHPHLFGGEFRSWGNLQEEILFCEFPKLAHLAFATAHDPCSCRDEKGKPTPFLVTDVKRHAIIHDLYNGNLNRIPTSEIESKIEYIEHHKAISVHILGMAAIAWEGINHKYSEMDLLDLLQTAFLAFDGTGMVASTRKPVIHTGCWGCGAFRNSEKTITVIQLTAAALAGVEIVFDGLDHPMTPHYTEAFLEEAKTIVASKRNAEEVFKEILQRQESDLTWAPKQNETRRM